MLVAVISAQTRKPIKCGGCVAFLGHVPEKEVREFGYCEFGMHGVEPLESLPREIHPDPKSGTLEVSLKVREERVRNFYFAAFEKVKEGPLPSLPERPSDGFVLELVQRSVERLRIRLRGFASMKTPVVREPAQSR